MSPAHLAEALAPGEVELGRGILFVQDYDEALVIRTLQRIVDGAHANDWSSLQAVVREYFEWLA
jgi:hypothetical protein